MQSIARLLWIAASLGGCGRLGFDSRVVEQDGPPGVAVLPALVEFEARCGGTGETGKVDIENTGEGALTIDAAEVSGGFTILSALPLTIAAGDKAQLDVKAPAAVIGTDRPGAMKVGSLMVTIGDSTKSVMLVANVTGADFTATDLAGDPVTLDLTGTSGACPPPRTVFLNNTGGLAATVMVTASSGLGISGFSGGAIDGGQSGFVQVRARTNGACSGTGTITYTATGDVCSDAPTVLQATFVITGSSSCACS